MAESRIPIRDGQFLDSHKVTTGEGLVERQVSVLADPTDPAELVGVAHGRLLVADDSVKSSFGALATTEERVVIWSAFNAIIPDRLWDTTVTGNGTVTVANGGAVVATGASGTAELRSERSIRYLPGQGVVFRCTCPFSAATSDSKQYVGLGDLTDGLGFGQDTTGAFIWVANAGVVTTVYQSSWNGDVGDGNGQLPLINWTLGSPLSFRFQWLGFGIQQFQVASPAGSFVTVHTVEYANSSTAVWSRWPSFTAFVRASSTTGNVQCFCPSIGVFTEGPEEIAGIVRAADQVLSVSSDAGTFIPLLTVRNIATIGGLTNKARISPRLFSVNTESGTGIVRARIIRNATLTGASYAQVASGQSLAEVDVTATAVADGSVIAAFGVSGGASQVVDLSPLGFQINPGDTLTLAVARVTGGAAINVYGSASWVELL